MTDSGKVTIANQPPYDPGSLTLQAEVTGGTATSYRWEKAEAGNDAFSSVGGTDSELEAGDAQGLVGCQFRVVATLANGSQAQSAPITVSVNSQEPNPEPSPSGPQEPIPNWHTSFSVVSLIVILVPAVAFLVWAAGLDFGTSEPATQNANSTSGAAVDRTELAADIAKPLMLIGTVLIAIGLWMVLTEWRGRFVKEGGPKTKAAADLVTLVDSLGKLKGATLVLITGVVLLLGPAWIGAASAGSESPPTPTQGDGSTPPASGDPTDEAT